MKNSILLFSILISISVFAQDKDEAQILALSKRKFEWMKSAKLDSLNALVDDRLSYIHSNGWVQTKREFLDDFTNGKLVYHDVVVSEANARVYKGSAVVTGKGQFTTTMNNNRTSVSLMFTEVYIKEKGNWKLVSRHANRLP
ncbi:MAG: nuclear transport factor 2 family protein [Bacteroidetes bacterium]|nr:nuclear transport factor 2 family protein [Bacteroidota bacterium]